MRDSFSWRFPKQLQLPSLPAGSRKYFPTVLLVLIIVFGSSGLQAAESEEIILPEAVPDRIEPLNRFLWDINKGLLIGVVQPSGKVYRAVVIKPIRTGIRNIGRNITYPGRLVNHLFQARWQGAGDETGRFLCNSVLGLGGFFDVATHLEIPRSDADSGQTFGYWGWKPKTFLMLPFFGPSNERDGLGLAADSAMSPITYFPPYSYSTYGISYNNLTETADDYVRLIRGMKDAYADVELVYPWFRDNRRPDFEVQGERDPATLETLRFVFVSPATQDFLRRGQTKGVEISKTGRELKYTTWMQPKPASIVYILPGLGSHRLSSASLVLGEKLYAQGYSIVSVSNPFSYEFLENASTSGMPAYVPADVKDLATALSRIDARLTHQKPGLIRERSLLGYSMGAFQALVLAATEKTNDTALKFDHYVAINPPVRLLYGVERLDEFYRQPLGWPAEERTKQLENTFLKVAALRTQPPSTNVPPFNAIESKFLIGMNFRLILRDLIFSSQQRHNMGVLKHPIEHYHRQELYREILRYSYADYFQKFAIPFYESKGLPLTVESLDAAGNLRTYADGLRSNSKIHVTHNRNDFLLSPGDAAWLEQTFGPAHLTLFDRGGHLGNLADDDVVQTILRGLREASR